MNQSGRLHGLINMLWFQLMEPMTNSRSPERTRAKEKKKKVKDLTNASGDTLQAQNVIFPQAPIVAAPPPSCLQIPPPRFQPLSAFRVLVRSVRGELRAYPRSSWTRMMFGVSSPSLAPSGWKMLVICASPH